MPKPMQLETESLPDDILKINLSGRMDVAGTQAIDLKFTGHAANRRAVIVDMSDVAFLASIGMRTLMLAAKAVFARGGRMVLLNPDSNVTHVLEMAGIDTLIPICRSQIGRAHV